MNEPGFLYRTEIAVLVQAVVNGQFAQERVSMVAA
jgi:hypothetical protein